MTGLFSSVTEKYAFLRDVCALEAAIKLGSADPIPVKFVPEPLRLLIERLGLSWSEFYTAVPVNITLTDRIVDEFLYWLLSVELKDHKTYAPVAELYRRKLDGDPPTKKEWAAAAWAARPGAAAWAAAEAAAEAEAEAEAEAAEAEAAAASYDRMRRALLLIVAGKQP